MRQRDYFDARLDGLSTEVQAFIADHQSVHQRSAEHVDRKVHELVEQLRRENLMRDEAMSTAILKAEAATNHRFESVNEFRATLSDQATKLLTRDEYLAAHQVTVDRINDLATRLTALESLAAGRLAQRTSSGQLYAWAIAGLSLIVSLILMLQLLIGA